jgi:hypothetical protein
VYVLGGVLKKRRRNANTQLATPRDINKEREKICGGGKQEPALCDVHEQVATS